MSMRNILPQRRACESFPIEHHGKHATVTIGYFRDGSIGEVFITSPKIGSDFEAIARDGAVLISLAIQYRVPLHILRHAITREENGGASTILGAVIDKLIEDLPPQ